MTIEYRLARARGKVRKLESELKAFGPIVKIYRENAVLRKENKRLEKRITELISEKLRGKKIKE